MVVVTRTGNALNPKCTATVRVEWTVVPISNSNKCAFSGSNDGANEPGDDATFAAT